MPFLTLPEFERHYAALREELVGRARTRLPSWDESEDAAQECYLAGHRAASQGANVRDVRQWLRGVLDNVVSEMRRRDTRRMVLTDAVFVQLESEPRGERAHQHDALVAALRVADIPPRQKLAVRLRLDGHGYKAIGSVFGVSAVAAREAVLAGIVLLSASPCLAFAAADLDSPKWRGQRVTVYHAPTTTGAGLARMALARLR